MPGVHAIYSVEMSLRISLRPSSILPAITLRPAAVSACRTFAFRNVGLGEADEEEIITARKWLAQFTPDSIPREYCDISFARSSGPGGQNVNKLNTKATVRLDLKKSRNFFPSFIMDRIRSSPQTTRYLTKNDELLLQSDTHRKQGANVTDCIHKLYRAIVDAADLPGETSAEQKGHVMKLQQMENDHRLKIKKFHSSKKSARRDKGDY